MGFPENFETKNFPSLLNYKGIVKLNCWALEVTTSPCFKERIMKRIITISRFLINCRRNLKIAFRKTSVVYWYQQSRCICLQEPAPRTNPLLWKMVKLYWICLIFCNYMSTVLIRIYN